jgi:predicted 3-demethylubiquinone-9 3-methyltransferase (glyoxalase superfamily)
MSKITLCLWFNGRAEEATAFYAGLFADTRIVEISRNRKSEDGEPDPARVVTMDLMGQKIIAINGGDEFALTPAISLLVSCETQEEVDRYWEGLATGGKPMRCGWITDRFGITWQIIPAALQKLLGGDAQRAGRAMAAACEMSRIDIAGLLRAAEG